MSQHRKRRRRRSVLGKRGLALFCGVCLLMLAVILALIFPRTRAQHISTQTAVALSLVIWVFGVIALWACVHSRRQRSSQNYREPFVPRAGAHDFDDD